MKIRGLCEKRPQRARRLGETYDTYLPAQQLHSQMTIVAESGHGCNEGSRIHERKYLARQNKGCWYK